MLILVHTDAGIKGGIDALRTNRFTFPFYRVHGAPSAAIVAILWLVNCRYNFPNSSRRFSSDIASIFATRTSSKFAPLSWLAHSFQVIGLTNFSSVRFQVRGRKGSPGVRISLAPFIPQKTIGVSGKAAAILAIPVFPLPRYAANWHRH